MSSEFATGMKEEYDAWLPDAVGKVVTSSAWIALNGALHGVPERFYWKMNFPHWVDLPLSFLISLVSHVIFILLPEKQWGCNELTGIKIVLFFSKDFFFITLPHTEKLPLFFPHIHWPGNVADHCIVLTESVVSKQSFVFGCTGRALQKGHQQKSCFPHKEKMIKVWF